MPRVVGKIHTANGEIKEEKYECKTIILLVFFGNLFFYIQVILEKKNPLRI